MAKIKKVANGEYIGANKYTIKDAGGGKSTVDFAPDSVLTPGTEVGAELLNEMQLNALYTLDTNRVVEGQKEVYVANLEGFTDFTKPDLSFYLKINANNTNAQTYLRLDATDYLIKCIPNDLTKNSIVACRKVGSEIIVLNNYIQRQDDAIWGGLDGGGEIENPDIPKEVGKRYIGADGKAYICLVPSNINNSTNYTPCNVVDNLDKLQNLVIKNFVVYGGVTIDIIKNNKVVTVTVGGGRSGSSIPNLAILQKIPIEIGYPKFQIETVCGNDQNRNLCLIGITTAGNLQVYKGDGDIPHNSQLRCVLTYITD